MGKYTVITDADLEVIIEKLLQDFTYGGLLEGNPNERIDKMFLERKISEAKKVLYLDEIYVITPEYGAVYRELPAITCIARLKTVSVFKDPKMDYSCLGVIWFQDEYAFPIDAKIIEKIKEIPFRELCGEFEQ